MRFLKRPEGEPAPVRRRRRRRLHRRSLYAATALVLAAGFAGSAWELDRTGLAVRLATWTQAHVADAGAALHLTVQSVEVTGRNRADKQAILAALAVRRGSPILALDLDAAKARLESVPWVRSAAIERLLPDRIFVHIVEHDPLAIWQHAGKFDLLDQDGGIIPGADVAAFPGLLQVVGDDAPPAASDLIDLVAAEPDLARHVTAAVRVGGRRWNIELDDGIEVALPEVAAGAAWHKLAALDASDRLLERDVKRVDMRLSDRVVLELSPDAAKILVVKKKKPEPNT